MFTSTLVVFTLVAAALCAPAPQVDIPVSVSVPVLSGNTGGNSNSILPILPIGTLPIVGSLPIVSGLPILGGLRRRQLGDLPIGGIVGIVGTAEGTVEGLLGALPRRQATGLPIGSGIGLVGTVDSALEGVIGDVEGILNGPLWYVVAAAFSWRRSLSDGVCRVDFLRHAISFRSKGVLFAAPQCVAFGDYLEYSGYKYR